MRSLRHIIQSNQRLAELKQTPNWPFPAASEPTKLPLPDADDKPTGDSVSIDPAYPL